MGVCATYTLRLKRPSAGRPVLAQDTRPGGPEDEHAVLAASRVVAGKKVGVLVHRGLWEQGTPCWTARNGRRADTTTPHRLRRSRLAHGRPMCAQHPKPRQPAPRDRGMIPSTEV